MRMEAPFVVLLAIGSLCALGCQNGAPWNAQVQQGEQQLQAQMQLAQQKAQQLDYNNRDLNRQVAEARQQAQLMQERVALLSKQLNETTEKLTASIQARQQTEQKVETLLASTRARGSATIRANSSLTQSLNPVEIPGVTVRVDGDTLRIELPSDKLFLPGTASLHQGSLPILDAVSGAIARSYPRQVVGIEGHTDNDPLPAGAIRSHHQLAAGQAQAVFDQFSTRGRLSPHRLFVLGHGANHPLVSNGTPEGKARNRRIEIVIYPETRD